MLGETELLKDTGLRTAVPHDGQLQMGAPHLATRSAVPAAPRRAEAALSEKGSKAIQP